MVMSVSKFHQFSALGSFVRDLESRTFNMMSSRHKDLSRLCDVVLRLVLVANAMEIYG
jgi:hypothetical protein